MWTISSTSVRHSATACRQTRIRRSAPSAIDAPELHAQRRQHLADVIVQLARELAALFFLRRHQLLRQLAQVLLGLLRDELLHLGSPFEHAQADDDRDGEQQTRARGCATAASYSSLRSAAAGA